MTKRAAKWWLWGGMVGVLVLYVLSPGPVVSLTSSMGAGPLRGTLQILYAPLESLYNHVEWVREFYDWWFEVWTF